MKSAPPSPRPRPLPSSLLAVFALAAAVPLAGVPSALAQNRPAAPATGDREPEPPFAGAVGVDRVEVRSGAGESYYPVAEFERGQRVKVVEDFYGWHRIEAPEGLHAYVAAKDLDRRGDGTVGVANADAVRVKIKGLDRGWDESFRTITFLNRGDRVRIVGAVGDEGYEILAPEGSLVFLPPGSVTPLASLPDGGGEPVAPPPPVAAGGEMVPIGAAPAGVDTGASSAAGTAPEPAPEADAGGAPEPPPGPEPPTTLPPLDLQDGGPEEAQPLLDTPPAAAAEAGVAASESIAAVEEVRLPQFALPLEEQPLDEMQAAYEDLLTDEALRPFERRLVESRLTAVERNRQLRAAIEQIQQRREELVDVAPTPIEPEPEAPYAAVGVLRTSSVFAGEEAGVALPKMYRVIDPATERTIAYLRPARGVEPTALLGRLVGVRGTREIDATLNTPLVTAQAVVALDEAE